MAEMPPYERFAAWQLCHALVLMVYADSAAWPRHELFGLVSQPRRAAASAPTNLVEGAAKRGPREFRRYLDFSNGSLAELGYLLRLARDLGYLTPAAWQRLEHHRDEAAAALWGLYASVRKRA